MRIYLIDILAEIIIRFFTFPFFWGKCFEAQCVHKLFKLGFERGHDELVLFDERHTDKAFADDDALEMSVIWVVDVDDAMPHSIWIAMLKLLGAPVTAESAAE